MNKAKENITPDYQDDVMKYIYLALAMRRDAKFAYIISLRLERDAQGRYTFAPKTHIDTFRDANRAELAYATMNEIKRFQHNSKWVDTIIEPFAEAIKNFNQSVR